MVCDNSSLFEINLGWKWLAASHHRGWEKKAPLPPGKQVSVFRLLPEADAPGAPGCRRGSAALGAEPGRMASFSQHLPWGQVRGQCRYPSMVSPHPHTCRKLQKKPGRPHHTQGTDVPGAKDQAGGGAPKPKALLGPPQTLAAMAGP